MESGYGNYDLRSRLNQLKLLLKNVLDFQMDVSVHQGTYTKEKVVDTMMTKGFHVQDRSRAPLETRSSSARVRGPSPTSATARSWPWRKITASSKGESFNTKTSCRSSSATAPSRSGRCRTKLAQ